MRRVDKHHALLSRKEESGFAGIRERMGGRFVVTGGGLGLGFLGFSESFWDDNRLQRGFLGQDGKWSWWPFMNKDDVFFSRFSGWSGANWWRPLTLEGRRGRSSLF